MGKTKMRKRLKWENLKGRDHMDDPTVNGRITLEWIIKTWDVKVWIGFI
jgi:hypothetical protein